MFARFVEGFAKRPSVFPGRRLERLAVPGVESTGVCIITVSTVCAPDRWQR